MMDEDVTRWMQKQSRILDKIAKLQTEYAELEIKKMDRVALWRRVPQITAQWLSKFTQKVRK